MFEGAEITPITLNVQSSVSSAQTVITPDGNYVAVTAAPYGYGGPVEILFVLTEQGDIVRFKVVSQKRQNISERQLQSRDMQASRREQA